MATINVPVARPSFGEVPLRFQFSVEERFKASLASAANRSPDFVSLDIIQEGTDPGTTTVTSRIASFDANAAAAVRQNLESARLKTQFASEGLLDPMLISVQVTACVPGYELSPMQTCQLCTTNYYCPGGTSERQACSVGSFSPPGANSSSQCVTVVFVTVAAKLPILQSNFTADFQAKFRAALALTAQVLVERVLLISKSSRDAEPQMIVNAEIAADNAASAEEVRGKMDLTSLNANLLLQGLPRCVSVETTVIDSGPQSSPSASTVSLAVVLGASIGGLALLMVSSAAGYVLLKKNRLRKVRTTFLKAVRCASAGESATNIHLPPDDKKATKKGNAGPRMQYTAIKILGKGNRGCVVKATKTSTQAAPVAIKVIVPKRGRFDQVERRQLEREATLLRLVTSRGCRSAVNAAEAVDLPQRDDACWFIMEALDGDTVAAEIRLRDAAVGSAVRASACIQAGRDVLAALKVLHSEGFVHCDVAPSNIVRLAQGQSSTYEYKLIDFGKALMVDEVLEGDAVSAAGASLAYRAPELFSRWRVASEADLWSLGATMLELVSGRPPHAAEGRAAVIKAGTEDRAPHVLDCLTEGQRQSFDAGLGKVIAKALEKKPENRY